MVQLSGGVVERSWMVADGPVGDTSGRRAVVVRCGCKGAWDSSEEGEGSGMRSVSRARMYGVGEAYLFIRGPLRCTADLENGGYGGMMCLGRVGDR